jgi:hypothetical protein
MDYLAAIEEEFVAARGGGFALSARDIEVALSWERLGIPLDVILLAMRDFNERTRKSPPQSLGAYSRAVEKSFALARTLRVGAHEAV